MFLVCTIGFITNCFTSIWENMFGSRASPSASWLSSDLIGSYEKICNFDMGITILVSLTWHVCFHALASSTTLVPSVNQKGEINMFQAAPPKTDVSSLPKGTRTLLIRTWISGKKQKHSDDIQGIIIETWFANTNLQEIRAMANIHGILNMDNPYHFWAWRILHSLGIWYSLSWKISSF